jgi:hypothetical protein
VRVAPLGLLLVAACTASPSRSATAPAPPGDVAYLLAVIGDAVEASALVPREDQDDVGAALPDAWTDGEDVWILGFTQAELDAIPWTPSDAPARAAGPSDFVLPSPAWRVRGSIEDGAAELTPDDGAPPELTVPGLPACPAVYGDDAYADVRCRPGACRARIEQRGCVIELDPIWCELEVRATLDGRGAPTFGEDSACEVLVDREGPRSVVECPDISNTRCQVHLYDDLEPISGEVIVTEIDDVEPTYFDDEAFEDFGFLTGMTVLDDRVVVVGYDGGTPQLPCVDLPTELTFLRRDDLSFIRTSTTVGCLREVVAAPDRASFYGIYGSGTDVHFAQFERDGTIRRDVLRISPEPMRQPEYRRIVLHDDDRYASFIELFAGSRNEYVVTVDLPSFTITDALVSDNEAARPYDLAGLDGGNVLLADRELNRIVLFDAVNGGEEGEFLLCDRAVHPESIFTDGRTAFTIAHEDDSSLVVLDLASSGAECGVAKPFVDHFDTREVVGFLDEDTLVVLARTIDPLDEAVLGRAAVVFYQRGRDAFRPAFLDLGRGRPRHGQLVDGVLYATLPYTAEVVRVLLAE